MRAADGVGVVQRQGRLPVPPRPYQRRPARSGPPRPKNAYVREDRILAHLPALYLLLTGAHPARRRRTRRGADTRPQTRAEDVIGYVRARGITLTYDPAAGTLQAGTREAIKTIIRKAG
jgi:site-specific DNA recombinase